MFCVPPQPRCPCAFPLRVLGLNRAALRILSLSTTTVEEAHGDFFNSNPPTTFLPTETMALFWFFKFSLVLLLLTAKEDEEDFLAFEEAGAEEEEEEEEEKEEETMVLPFLLLTFPCTLCLGGLASFSRRSARLAARAWARASRVRKSQMTKALRNVELRDRSTASLATRVHFARCLLRLRQRQNIRFIKDRG